MTRPSEIDFVRPGEQWFFYWKTSAALWESKILEFSSQEVIFLPLYWGFHSESSQRWDFGELHPERDLARLCQLLTQHGRKFCWLLPLTPSAFLPNGGIPAGAARTLSTTRDGLHLAVIDHEAKLNKIYSYFEPRVFKAFAEFVTAFEGFLSQHRISAPVWGTIFSYQEQGQLHSYLEDHSFAFEQGFSRYLKRNNPEGISFSTPAEEQLAKDAFTTEVQSLFIATAETGLSSHWKGVQRISLLGGSPTETIERSLESGKSQLHYFDDVFSHFARNEWMSSALLMPQEKKGLLGQVMIEHFGTSEIEERYQLREKLKKRSEEGWRAYGVVQLLGSRPFQQWEQSGLIAFLDQHYRSMYQAQEKVDFTIEGIESAQQMIKIFSGEGMDRASFGQMLQLFLMGQKVVLDISGLSEELNRRLQLFYLENNLNVQQVNYLTATSLCELGEGRFVTYEGARLREVFERGKFWKNLFQWFRLTQPEVLMDQEVFGLWRIRPTSAEDLNYLDVRRFSLYNPTSYKKHVTIHTQKNFAFMRLTDPQRAQAKSTPEGVEVELSPGGRVSLDFGHYEVS